MSFLRSVSTVGSFTLISRISGFARDVLMAAYLGAGAVADAFFIAFQFPNLFRSLFAEGAFSAGFVPIFSQTLARDGKEKAKLFAEDALAVLATTLLIFSVVMIVTMPVILFVMAPGFADIPGQMERTTELARIAFPYLFFISLTALQSGVLNAFDKFAAAAFAPVLLNLTLIAALLVGVGANGDTAFFLAWGVFVSGVVQFLWLAAACRSIGMTFRLRRPRLTPEVKVLLTRMVPVMFGAGIYQLNLVVNKIVATLISAGAVSWLYYADRVNLLPVGIIGFSIGVALVPLLSRHIQNGDTAAALADQNQAIELSLLLTIPAAVGIAVLAEPITSVLFERGAFTPADREAVALALLAFSIGLPAYVLNKALTPGFFSRGDTKTPVKAALAAFIVCVALNLGLMKVLGHVGIALATSVAAWVNITYLTIVLHRRGYLVPNARLWLVVRNVIIAGTTMGLVVWTCTRFSVDFFGPLFGSSNRPSGAALPRSLVLIGLIAVGAIVYGSTILLTGTAKLSDLRQLKRQPKA